MTAKFFDSETVLDDDYPVYLDYWYICDGKPRRCPIWGTPDEPATVRDLRRAFQCEEVRRCDILARTKREESAQSTNAGENE